VQFCGYEFTLNSIPWVQICTIHGALRITETKYRLFLNKM